MALVEIDWKPSSRNLRVFGAALTVLGLFLALLLRGESREYPLAAALLAVLGGGAALFRPGLLRPLYLILQVLTWPLGLALSHLLLAVMFYLVLTPIGFLRRAAGRDPLGLRRKEAGGTFWVKREGNPKKERYFSQF